MSLSVIILAGGTGSRMGSKLPKVLHELAGKPLLAHVIDHVHTMGSVEEVFVVHGHGGAKVMDVFADMPITWVEQKERLGTGHAVMQVMPKLNPRHQVLILYGDVPLVSSETLSALVKSTHTDQLGLLVAEVEKPKGLGRIIRDEYHQVAGIIEEKDATDLQKQIKEINTGIYCVYAEHLMKWLPQLTNDNAQGEYYLTDIVSMAKHDEVSINVSSPVHIEEILGCNSRLELAHLERIYQEWAVTRLMNGGVSCIDPARVDLRGHVASATDCTVDVNVILDQVTLAENCYIGANSVLTNVVLGRGVMIKPGCVIENAVIEESVVIGPYAHLRPGTVLKAGSKVGNFVEVKKSEIGQHSKVNHLSYIGDAQVGQGVNIGAGTITCNYDGENKHPTIIEDDVFIGSDSQLVAPVRVAKGATVGAGTTVTRDVPEQVLVINPKEQQLVKGWKKAKQAVKS